MQTRHRLLITAALGTGLLAITAAVMLRRAESRSGAPYGVTAPANLQGAARHAWHVRPLGHKRLIQRLELALGATTQPTTQQFEAAATFVETAEGATFTFKPLHSAAVGERFVEMSVHVKDELKVDAWQTESLGLERIDGRWQIRRINVYGFDDLAW